MALGLFSKEPGFDYKKELTELKAIGVNSILLSIHWFQFDVKANTIEPRGMVGEQEFTLPDVTLINVIRHAHELGMSVLLFPYIRLDHRAAREWRGVIKPSDFPLWSRSYRRFILHYAKLAQANGVELFSVGSELNSMEEKTEFWTDLIAQVRGEYRGKLLYSANWDHYNYPTFWAQLDHLAITAYYRLSFEKNPEYSDLVEKWQELKRRILAFQSKYGKKLLITEIGYPSIDGATKNPWNYFMKGETDPLEQAMGYRAFMEAWDGAPELGGVYWWVWYGEGGMQDRSYTPRGKPAEQLLGLWYKDLPPSGPQTASSKP